MKKEKITYQTEEQKELTKFIIVLVVLVLIILGVYFLSKVLLKIEVPDYEYTTGVVSTDIVVAGTMLNAKEKEYYVLAYDTKGVDAAAYTTFAGYYKTNKKDALKVYFLDLNNGLNKDHYVKEKSNPSAKTIKELKILDGTLIKVKNGKITKYIEGKDKIANELKAN